MSQSTPDSDGHDSTSALTLSPGVPRSEKRSEVVAREIVHDIARRHLPAGTKLPDEAAMLVQYRVGRATLREALRILEVQGLIAIRPGPGGGPVVAPPHPRDFGRMATLHFHMTGATFRELAEARLALEPLMARLAAERRDKERNDELLAIAGRTVDGNEVPDDEWVAASTDFHGRVASMSGNHILDLFGQSLKEIWTDRTHGSVFPDDARQRVHADHDAIARAVARGDAKKAETLMRKHMEEFVSFVAQRHPGILDEVVDWR